MYFAMSAFLAIISILKEPSQVRNGNNMKAKNRKKSFPIF